MGSGRIKQPTLAITVIALAAAVMLVVTTTEMAITGYAFAYNNRNQAASQADACGNGQEPTNIGCQNTDSQIQGDENSVALTSQQTFPSVTREPPTTQPEPPSSPEPTGFTIEGTGEATTGEDEDKGETFTCNDPGVLDPGIPLGLLFSVQSDGTVSGTYTLTAIRAHTDVFKGIFTFGSTDGDTFSLDFFSLPVGIEGLCGGVVGTDMVEISGHCGDEVTIRYEDPFASGTFTGNVDCTLIF